MVDAAALCPVCCVEVVIGGFTQQRLGRGDLPDELRMSRPEQGDDADHVRAGHRGPADDAYAVSLEFVEEREGFPGAAMSGLIRPEPSIVTGPRLEKPATVVVPVFRAAVEYDAA